MLKLFQCACLAAALVLPVLPAGAQTRGQTPVASEREAIEKIVRDYLLAHPEVIEEAVARLREKHERDTAAAHKAAVDDNRAQIFESANQMVLGNPQGKVTLVEFFDYNCGYCKRAVADLLALIESNPDLRVVMKELPILSPGSVEAARVSVAIKDMAPDKYLAFHQELFSRPGEANSAKALEIVRDLGLDAKAIAASANRASVTGNLQEVQKLAEKLGINGTPSYVLGDELLPGAAGFDVLQQVVASVRACGAVTC